ncbi:hypothetical protein L227DRAFT_565270 [Lentinus tigrinus ALCF2SS1-6]|uniref:Uncharacterized protein n=1 Tax=Lentinus tigrinus ALCF2SS1-6 TaxID=1328759 RepID=A0A5C2S233_9APHY|nr:hypothetical protein L227DRAFT_565270 [Lentinus tigrinus ALCF2SS1-6]
MEPLLDCIQVAEQLTSDAAHTIPVLKFLMKRTTKDQLAEIVGMAMDELLLAGDIILDPPAKKALQDLGLYDRMFQSLTQRTTGAKQLERRVEAVKFYEFRKKYTLYGDAVNERSVARHMRIDFKSKSQWAQFGGTLGEDGQFVPHTAQVHTPPPQAEDDHHAPDESTQSPLPPYPNPDPPHSDGSDDSQDPNADAHSVTNSVFGNHWDGYILQGPTCNLQSSCILSRQTPRVLQPRL